MRRPLNKELKLARTNNEKRALKNSFVQDAPPQVKEPPALPRPRSEGQKEFFNILAQRDRPSHLLLVGPAGTGKTFLAVRWALHMGLRMVISRPAVSSDEKHGFLPGSIDEKMEPWLLPIADAVNEATEDKNLFAKMIKDKRIVIAPLAYVRGRTFKDCVMILDEAQNTTAAQVKLWMTRIGMGSINIMSGDTDQYDSSVGFSGLKKALELFDNPEDPHVATVQFNKGDIQRHPSIGHVLSKNW